MKNKHSRGIIKTIILIIIALVLLKYFFNISFSDLIHNQVVSEIWSIIVQVFELLWQLLLLVLGLLKQFVSSAQTTVSSISANTGH